MERILENQILRCSLSANQKVDSDKNMEGRKATFLFVTCFVIGFKANATIPVTRHCQHIKEVIISLKDYSY
jgi:hypothetical protein